MVLEVLDLFETAASLFGVQSPEKELEGVSEIKLTKTTEEVAVAFFL